MSELSTYIEKRNDLFWSVKKEKRRDVSEMLVVETILNYGTLEDVRELFKVLGLAHFVCFLSKIP